MNKVNKQNRDRLIDRKKRLTAVRGEGLDEKGEGTKERKTHRHKQQNASDQRERGMGLGSGG